MVIKNNSNGNILTKHYQIYNSIWKKARGLMFSRQKNLVFKFRNERIISLHMFFVFFPIDVVYLDKDRQVVDIKENFRPFSFYTSEKMAKYVIELKRGRISDTNTNIGDIIDF